VILIKVVYQDTRTCKYWKIEPKECKRKKSCKYLHKDIKPSCVKTSEDNIYSIENSKADHEVEMINNKKNISDTEDILVTKEEEIKKLEDVEAIKEINDVEIIKELKDVEPNLK
jgi:hypothetical protein